MGITVQEALEKEKEKKSKRLTVADALKLEKSRTETDMQSALSSLQEGFSKEIDSYKSLGDLSFGTDLKSVLDSTRESRVNLGNLRRKVDAYRKYLGDDKADEILSYIDKMKSGYNSYLSNAEIYSTFKTKAEYDQWISDSEEYEKKKTLDLGVAQQGIDDLEELLKTASAYKSELDAWTENVGDDGYYYNNFMYQEIERKYMEESSDPKVYMPKAKAEYDAYVQGLKADFEESLNGYESLDALKSDVSNKKLTYNQAKRIQEGIRLSGVADAESEFYDPEFDSFDDYNGTSPESVYDSKDDLYEYVNNYDDFRSKYKRNHRTMSSDNPFSDGVSSYEEKGYDFLNEQEVAIFNYYYAKDGKKAAEKYLDSIQESLVYRKTNEKFKDFEGNTISELLFAIPAGVDQFETGLKNLFNFTDDYIPVSDTQALSQMIREDLADDGFKLPEFLGGSSLGQVAYDIGTTTSNMLPSIIVGAATGSAAGTVLLGASAAGNAYQEMLNLGYDKGQARMYSTLVGASEAGLEYLLGGISALGGKATGGITTKLLSKIDNAYARVALRFGGSMLSEGFEEGLQEYLEPWFKSIAMNTDYEAANIDEILYSSLLGALSAFGLEGGNIAVSEYSTYAQGKNIKTYGDVNRLVELGKSLSADTVANQLAGRVTKNTGAYTIGRLFNEVGASLSRSNIAYFENALEQRGIDKKHAKILVEGLENTINGVELTERQRAALEKNPVLADVLNDFINQNTTEMQRNIAYKQIANRSATYASEMYGGPEGIKALVDEGLASPDGSQSKALATKYSKILESGKSLSNSQIQKLVDANKEQIAAEEADAEAKVFVENSSIATSEDGRTIDTKTGSNIKIKEIVSIKDGEMVLRTEDGKTVNAKDVSFGDGDSLIYSAVLDMGLNAASANSIIKNYDPSGNLTASQYVLGVKEAYKYGSYGFPIREMSLDGYSADLSVAQKSLAYRLGASDAKHKAKADQAKITDAIEARKQSGVEKAEAKGKLRFTEGEKKVMEGLSSNQKAVVEFFRDIAVATPSGLRLTKKLVVDANGKKVEVNGLTNLTTGEMVFSLDSNASRDPVAALLFTAGHESGHYIKRTNPQGFKRLGEFLAKEYGKKGESVHARVLAMQKNSKNNLTYDEAHEEWVCQSLQRMFASVINNKDSGVLQRLQQYDNKVAQLLYKALSKLASKINSLLEKLTPGTFEEQFVAEMDAAARKLFEAMYAEELVTAIDNAQWLGGVDVMNDILGNKTIEVGKTSLQEMNRRQTRFQEKTEYEAQPKEIITIGTDATKPKANRKTLGGRNKITIAGKTFNSDVSVKELRDARFKENGFSKKEIDKHNEFIQHMTEMMEEARVKYRFIGLDDIYNAKILISPTSGEITVSALVNNGDYPINFDFTKICKKRVALQQIVDQLARQKGKKNADGSVTEVNLSPENIKAINDVLAEAGIETACLCCFVESKRYNIQSLIQDNVIDVWNSLVDEFDSDAGYFNFADESVNESKIPDKEFDALYEQVLAWRKQKGKSSIPKEKMQQFLETTPAARKKLRFSDIVTEKGRTNLHKLYPDIEGLIGSTLGTAAPKSVEAFAPYNGEIDLMESTSETDMGEYLFSIAGARSQSFSDFMIAHIFDVVQKTASLSARKFPAHVYTKEIARARLFGMTGEKHNMSVLFNIDPEVDSWNAGLKKDGSYFLSDYKAYKSGESQYIQSIGWDEAVSLQNTEGYSKDCGIIAVGFSYNNMIKIHNDPDVRQVIGYHTSSLPAVVKPLTHLDKATDYTPVQNTLAFVGFVKPMYAIPEGVPSYATPPQDVKPTKGTAKTKKVNETFDIKATFEKLAKGKKGEARTQAAKETLRQLLEYADSHGLALATQKAEAGHGDFDLYSDVAKTKNPYMSADHYIEYCIERGYLPAFFEFSMNPNYYKDIFDFNVFDRLSYNPETGLHEDSEGRQAYAPQTAVHMLNEDGSYAFPSDFFEIIDKQMKNYDEYSQMVEEKMPSVMKKITSIDGMTSNLKFQFRMETDPEKISMAENLEKEGASRKAIWDRQGIIRDAGGHWVTEFSDKYARIYPSANATGETPTGTIRLKNIFKHPELYTRFPEAAEIVIDLDIPEESKTVAKYNSNTNTISLNKRHLKEGNKFTLKKSLLHEIQHFIQNQEGRPRGASVKYYESLGMSHEEAKKAYFYTAGEIEARMTADRMDRDDRQLGSEIPDYQWGKAKIRYQERSTEDISNRGLLANALESAATTGEEKNLLRNYKTNIRLIESEQKKLSEIKDKLFAKGSKIEPEERKKLQSEMKQASTRINSYDRQLLKLEAMKPIKKVLEREKELAQKRQKQKDMQLLTDYKEKSMATVKELMKRNQESRQKAIEGRDKTLMRNKIKGIVNELNQLLLKGTKDKHVMIGLQKAVASALDAVNMDTVNAEERVAKYNALIAKAKDPDVIASLTASRDRIAEQGGKISDRLTELKDAYSKIKNSDDPLIANSHDEVIENKIESVVNSIGNTPLRNMTLSQLEDVYDMYKMVLTTIRNSNKAFKMEKAESISALGNNIMGEIHSIAGEKQYTAKALEGLKSFGWSSLKPTQAFETIGSGTFKKVFANVRAGEDTWAVDVSEARDYYREKSSKYGYDSWDLDKRYEFTSKGGKKFSLSLEQIMSLYAYSKRKQADLHLEQGGFVFDESIEVVEKKKGIPIKYKVNTANAYSLSKEELGNIIGTLSDGQKNFVDEMQAYLSDVMGAKGNEVSLEMYGVKLFKEKFYFPLKSAKQFMFEQNEVAGEVKIKNSGFSKETVARANNPIILSNFMDVWANHVNEMSMYHAFVLPLEDFNRVFNYKTPTSDTMNPESVKSYLQNAYGTQPVQYIKQLITDLNGGARVDAQAGFVNKGIALFKKGAVFASASVVIQQPSAIARAFAYINPKYFVTAKVDLTKHSRDWEECKQYAPVARIKEMGYFDTNVGPQTTEWITSKEYKGFKEKFKGVFKDSNYRDELLSKAPALADELAWTHIWNAVKKEIASTTDLKVGSEEFLKRAGERFTDVIVNTQVYDSVLTRNGLMRSKDTGVKMATAFMAEPTTSINMIVNAFIQAKRGNKKLAMSIAGGVASSIILNSILVSLVYAARDDDEDETYAEKYLGSLTSELVDGFNPITYIPFAKDIWSIAQGYDVERSDMSTYSKLWQSFEELFDEKKSVTEKVHDFAGSVATVFGLPLKNIIRDADAVLNLATNDLGIADTTAAGVGYSVSDALRNSIPLLGRFYEEDTKAQKLYNAVLGGDATEIARAKTGYKDQKAIDSALSKALRENDSRIKEAAQARINGDITKYKSLVTSITSEGNFSQDLVVKAINSAINLINKEADDADGSTDDEDDSKETSIYKASDINAALENGDTSAALEVIGDLVEVKTNNYIAEGEKKKDAEKKAKSSVKSSLTSYWKPLYLAAYKSKNNAEMTRIRKLLKATKLYDDVVETCQDWVKQSK